MKVQPYSSTEQHRVQNISTQVLSIDFCQRCQGNSLVIHLYEVLEELL